MAGARIKALHTLSSVRGAWSQCHIFCAAHIDMHDVSRTTFFKSWKTLSIYSYDCVLNGFICTRKMMHGV